MTFLCVLTPHLLLACSSVNDLCARELKLQNVYFPELSNFVFTMLLQFPAICLLVNCHPCALLKMVALWRLKNQTHFMTSMFIAIADTERERQ